MTAKRSITDNTHLMIAMSLSQPVYAEISSNNGDQHCTNFRRTVICEGWTFLMWNYPGAQLTPISMAYRLITGLAATCWGFIWWEFPSQLFPLSTSKHQQLSETACCISFGGQPWLLAFRMRSVFLLLGRGLVVKASKRGAGCARIHTTRRSTYAKRLNRETPVHNQTLPYNRSVTKIWRMIMTTTLTIDADGSYSFPTRDG